MIRRTMLALALLAAALAAPPLWAQGFGGLGLGAPQGEEAAPQPEAEPEAEPEADPERPPDLAAYGEIAETYLARSALDFTQRELDRFRGRLLDVVRSVPRLGDALHAALAAASPTGRPSWFLGLGAFLAFLIAVGRGATQLYAVYVARPIFVGLQRPDPGGLVEKLPVLAARVGLVTLGLAITLLVAVLVGSGFYPDDEPVAVRAAIVAFTGYAAMRLADTIWRMLLAPYLPEYRAPAIGDRDAVRLYRWAWLLVTLGVTTTWALYWLRAIGLPHVAHAALHIPVMALLAAVAGVAAWTNRAAITRALLGGRERRDCGWLAAGAATLWLPMLLLYLAAATAENAYRAIMGAPLGPPPLGVAFIVFLTGLGVYGLAVFVIARVARRRAPPAAAPRAAAELDAPDPGLAEPAADAPHRDARADGDEVGGEDEEGGGPAPEPTAPVPPRGASMRSFEDLAHRVASLFAIAAGFYVLVRLWFGPTAFREDAPQELALGVIDIVFFGYVLYHAVRIWIDQRIEAEGGEELDAEPGDEGGGRSAASRLATLLPLVRSFVLALIAASAAIFVAMELGLNVAPLLGGAGVIGLAIGFGSQTLVRDILSGAFFLIDDAFRKGEYVDIGEVKGTVERISLRSFQLRHHLGALNTIPFGEVRYLTNYSRDWVMMKLPLRLTYDTDVEKVRKLVKKLGQELLEHPEEGHKFVQPLKSQGVYQMEDSAMIVRVKFMTRPGDQWTTRKLVYQRLRELFAREGIKFAHREVTVRLPDLDTRDPRDLSEEERAAVGAAARRATDLADEERQLRPVAVGDDR